jgi:hypothetical protein
MPRPSSSIPKTGAILAVACGFERASKHFSETLLLVQVSTFILAFLPTWIPVAVQLPG